MTAEQRGLTRDELRDILGTALSAGRILLECGANTARVEDTVRVFGTSLGADALDVAVTGQAIWATVSSGLEHRTRIVRLTRSGFALDRLDAVVALAQRVQAGGVDRETAQRELELIGVKSPAYPQIFTAVAVGVACAAFAMLFGGTWTDFAIVAVSATAGQLLRHWLLAHDINRITTTALVATFASAAGLWLSRAAGGHSSIAVAGSVLLLVPGVLLVSGTADVFRGDTLSGASRALSASLSVMSIGVGVWATLLMSHMELDVVTGPPPPWWLVLGMAFVGAGGFAILFGVPRRSLFWAAAAGAVAVWIRDTARTIGLPAELTAFLSGFAIGVYAEVLGSLRRQPSSLFSIPAYITLVPGVPALYAVLELANQRYETGIVEGARAFLIVMSIAFGLGTVSAWTRRQARFA